METCAGKIGHKRIIAVYGEHPLTGIDYILESMKTIYDVKTPTKHGYGNIRRINVNAAPMSIDEVAGPSPPGSWYQRGRPLELPKTARARRLSSPWFAWVPTGERASEPSLPPW